jgi:imidazoleglycerol phosphate dehydratase HisB
MNRVPRALREALGDKTGIARFKAVARALRAAAAADPRAGGIPSTKGVLS